MCPDECTQIGHNVRSHNWCPEMYKLVIICNANITH